MNAPVSVLFPELNRRRYRDLLELFGSQAGPERRRLLDVGCGHGAFVAEARRCGWDATGIDLSEAAVRLAERHGIPVTNADFFALSCPLGSLDVVTMFELLEHVPGPARFIARAAEVLKEGGLLYLTTPNFGCLDRRLAGPDWGPIHSEHLGYYTPRTLRPLLAAEPRFTVLRLTSRNVSLAGVRASLWRAIRRSQAWASAPGTVREADQSTRTMIEGSRLLSLLKRGTNALLGSVDLGNTIVALCKRV